MEAKPGAGGAAARDQRAGTPGAELMSQRTVYILGNKEMQARYRTEQSNRLSGTLRSKAKHTLSHTAPTAPTLRPVCSHVYLCVLTLAPLYRHTLIPAYMYTHVPSPLHRALEVS